MPTANLTARTVTAARSGARAYILYDKKLPGFGLRVTPRGHKAWVVEFRPRASGRSPKQRITLGSAGVLTAVKARQMAQDTLAAVRGGADPVADRRRRREAPTIQHLAARFLAEQVDRRRKPTTAAFYRRALELYVLPRFGSLKVADLKRSDLLKLHSHLSSTAARRATNGETAGKTGVGRPVMANRVLAVVGSMYAWGAKHGLVLHGHNPAAGVEKNPEAGRERFLGTEELERLGRALRQAETDGIPWLVDEEGPTAKHLPGAEHRRTILSPYAVAALRLLILTGCRLREILHLRWSEVDFDRGMLHLPDSKTGRKSVVLNAPALSVLEAIPRLGEFVIAGRAPSKKGGVERPRSDLKKPWESVRRVAGLEGVRIHDLRHTYASVGASAGLGLPIVGKLLGHTQASTTQKYAHLDNDPLRRATNAIGATIAAALAGDRSETVVPIDKAKRVHPSRG